MTDRYKEIMTTLVNIEEELAAIENRHRLLLSIRADLLKEAHEIYGLIVY